MCYNHTNIVGMKKYSYILYKYCRERTSCKITLVAFVWLFPTVCFQMSPQVACLRGCKVALVAFVSLFSIVGSQMSPQIACLRGCIVALVAFFYFPHWVLKCLLELHSRIGCICLTFLHCGFSNVSSNCLHQRMHSDTGCICLTFLHCVFSNVSSNRLHKRIHSRIGCIFLFSPLRVFK